MRQILLAMAMFILGAFVWLACVKTLIQREVVRVLNDQPALAKIIDEGVKEAIDEFFEEENKSEQTME